MEHVDQASPPHKPVYGALSTQGNTNVIGLPFNANNSIKMSTIGAGQTMSGQFQSSTGAYDLADLRAKIAQRMEYSKVDMINLNYPDVKDDVEVPSYASSTDLYERNRME